MLTERISRYVRGLSSDGFDGLAIEGFAFQYERIAPYRELCDRAGANPDRVRDWRDIPMVPAPARESPPTARPGVEVRHGGSASEDPARRYPPFPDLYRTVIDQTFPPACLGAVGRPSMLSLFPSRRQAPESSHSFLCDHAMRSWGAEGSAVAFGAGGIDLGTARSWLAARQRDQRPGLILATAPALERLLGGLERQDLRFRLPVPSRLLVTGGFPGETREVIQLLLKRIADRLAIPADGVVREYGPTGHASHFYSRAEPGPHPEVFAIPRWTRVRILVPGTLDEAGSGSTGLIAVLDLASVGSALHLLTGDLGVAEGDGFRLVGRALGAGGGGGSLTAHEGEGAR